MPELCDKEVDQRILTTQFACDLGMCHGACCTFPGGAGAPVALDEVPILHRAWDALQSEVPAEHRAVVARDGLFEHLDGGIHLRCYNDRACVFVRYDGAVAKCAIEMAWREGRFPWIKPVSCHLFPIRVSGTTRQRLRFEEFSECMPARARGEASKTSLSEFLREPVERAFGRQFAEALCAASIPNDRDRTA